jgi:hypothetical protein
LCGKHFVAVVVVVGANVSMARDVGEHEILDM